MHCLTINNIPYSVPSSWNELTKNQLLSMVDMYNKQYNLMELSVKLLLIITGLKVVFINKYPATGYGITIEVYQFRHGRHSFIIELNDIVFAASKLQFMFRIEEKDGQTVYSLNSKLSKNLLPQIRFGRIFKRTWHGPADSISNISFSEFIHAETAYDKLLSTSREQYLNRLVAILYRPAGDDNINSPDFRGDVRRKFNDFLIEKSAKKAASMSKNFKTAVLIYYIGCRYAITRIFPEVFKGSASDIDTFKSYMNLVETLSNYDITKKEEIRGAYLYDVLLTLNQSIIRDREREKEIKKLRRV